MSQKTPKNGAARRSVVLALGLTGLAALTASAAPAALVSPDSPASAPGRNDLALLRAAGAAALGAQPLRFEPNLGQSRSAAAYIARGTGYGIFLSSIEVGLSLLGPGGRPGGAVRVQLRGGSPAAQLDGEGRLPGVSHYIRGADPSTWQHDVPGYGAVRAQGIYPGIDLLYYGRAGGLEYDFVLAAGADPGRIRLRFAGIDGAPRPLSLDRAGGLQVDVDGQKLTQPRPVAYQERGSRRIPVKCDYVVGTDGEVTLSMGRYDRSRPLVIDPVLTYASFHGGRQFDEIRDIAVAGGSVCVTGVTASLDFPTEAAIQGSLRGNTDAFVSCFAGGCVLRWSTYLGGEYDDWGNGLVIDETGAVLVTGLTYSSDFPITAYNPPAAGNGTIGIRTVQPSYAGNGDAFLTRFSADGSLITYSTFLGGSGVLPDEGRDVDVDSDGNAYITGVTGSDDFPVTVGAYQTVFNGLNRDAFVSKIDPDLLSGGLIYSTYLGGGVSIKSDGSDYGNAIRVDSGGRAFVGGTTNALNFPLMRPIQAAIEGDDGFVSVLNAAGSALDFSTIVGGDRNDSLRGLDLRNDVEVYVTGGTNSRSFGSAPLQSGRRRRLIPPPSGQRYNGGDSDGWVAMLTVDPVDSTWNYFRFFGGAGTDFGNDVAADDSGRAWVTGGENFRNAHPRDPFRAQREGDASIKRFSADGSQESFSTTIRGSRDDAGNGIALDGFGGIHVGGATFSRDLRQGKADALQPFYGGDGDGFIARLTDKKVAGELRISPHRLQIRSKDGGPKNGVLRIKNVGKGPLLVTVPQFEPLVTSAGGYPTEDDFRFLVIEGAGTFVLAPGEVHKVVIRFFAPLGEGKDTLVITSSSPGAEACLKVRVIGIIKRGPGAPGD